MLRQSETHLQSVFTESEFCDFKGIVQGVCEQYPDITGIALTGSLTQRILLPTTRHQEIASNKVSEAYALIENRDRRRIFPSKDSDLDLWVCTKNPDDNCDFQTILESRAIELLRKLNENRSLHGTPEWINLKQKCFNDFYKQEYLYRRSWKEAHPENPWMATSFKKSLILALEAELPSFVERINYNFTSKVQDDFFEVRAYPEATFNLRVEELFIDKKPDKTPFPFILRRLLDIDRNCFVVYVANDGAEETIYPFNLEGPGLGDGILDFIMNEA